MKKFIAALFIVAAVIVAALTGCGIAALMIIVRAVEMMGVCLTW